jgi:pimeloyl-ACP methyl ester carboxylesterase
MNDRHAAMLGWRSVDVNGSPTSYLEVGTGPTLVFLHGWGLDYASYRPGLTRLAGLGVRVLAPAMPAFGGTSELGDDDFSLKGYADWVLAFLDGVGIDEPVMLVGHSFGGGVAIRVAYDAPERVAQLVLVNSIGGSAWAQGSVVRTLAERPLWDWGLHVPADLWPHRQLTRVLPVLVDGLLPNVLRNPRAVWRVAGLARRADLSAELEELKRRHLPVVILWGVSDQIIPPEALKALQAALGEVEVVSVEGSHNWLIADPGGFCELMTNILELASRTDLPPSQVSEAS